MKVIINQPFGLGDILFLSPLISKLDISHGIWPVVDHYYWISEYIHIDNVNFIQKSEFDINYYKFKDYTEIPFLHAQTIAGGIDCMEAKYNLFNVDLSIWETLKFKRNLEKESQLKQRLNINTADKFIIVNNNFAGPEYNYKIDIKLQTNLRIIHQEYIEGFTLLDWCGVLEQAKEIHTVVTSLYFVINALKLINTPIHLYPRKPLEKNFDHIKSLINNNWIYHE